MIGTLSGMQSSARRLIERVHPQGAGVAEEYPLVFQEGAEERIFAIGDEDEARSACTVLPRDFLLAGSRIRGALIGSVSTDPAWRNRGLGSRLMAEAEQKLSEEGCAFALLWAPDPAFYFRLGYCPIGVEYDFAIDGKAAAALPNTAGVRPMREDDAADIHRLYKLHHARLDRRIEETTALLRCPGMRVLVRERNAATVAYACLGRGTDFADVVHEWGGDAYDVLALIRSHHEQRFAGEESGSIFVISSPHDEDLNLRLVAAGVPAYEGFLGLAKIIDRKLIAEFLDERLGDDGRAELVETHEGQRIRIEGENMQTAIDDDAALALLFPVADVRASVEELFQRVGIRTDRLPLLPFAWGLDSI